MEKSKTFVSLTQAIKLLTFKLYIMTYDFNNKTINDLKTRVNVLNTLLSTTAKEHYEIIESAISSQIKYINYTITNLEDAGVCPDTHKISL